MMRPSGRVASLLAWGLLIGGVTLLVTFPGGDPPGDLDTRYVPAAILFALAGAVFGASHPEGRAWRSAVLLAWLPPVAAVVTLAGSATLTPVWIVIAVAPALLAAGGGWVGARIARPRSPSR